ncbi:MAG: hypothetical protein JF615_14190 [Asticcacaulis sp.]|nr:hypothetical protein [Asticcacaulis sp.]
MSLQAIHTRATKFQSIVFWRNTREYLASLVVAVLFGWFAYQSDNPLFRVACGLIVAGAAFVSLFLFLNGRADRAAATVQADCLAFHRNALRRQSRLLRGVWLWYLLPMVPGMSLFLWVTAQDGSTGQPWSHLLRVVVAAMVFIGVGALNTWGAHRIDKELAKLDQD